MKRLSQRSLQDTSSYSSHSSHGNRPGYDREQIKIGIVHLGIGAFHRAHMAAYVDRCLDDDPRWGICGVSLRSCATRDALAPQNGLYTLGVRSGEGMSTRIIGAVKEVLVASEDAETLSARLQSPDTRILSLTVTEKGYCHDPAAGRLNLSHPEIVHDLQNKTVPRTAIGWIAHGLLARRAAGVAPFTVLSCDNLPSNGQLLRQVLLDFLAHKAPDSVAWANENLACPSTMVDRIVPATTKEDRTQIAAHIGREDAWPVVTEPFTQFVVEDHFPLGRPAWEQHGVTMSDDAKPFETMKLRMLNGSHSTLAYLGLLAGDETVADTMADLAFRALIGRMLDEEIAPTLAMPDGVDLLAYREQLLTRFANTALRHKTSQIAMDGSQKLPQRLLGTISDRLTAGQSFDRLALGVAGWMRYAMGRDEAGNPMTVLDPMADQLAHAVGASDGGAASLVDEYLKITEIFGERLPQDHRFRHAVHKALECLLADGARATIARYCD
jgi:fructuronate reductase